MHVCFTQIEERVVAAPGYSLLAKTVYRAPFLLILFKAEPLQAVYEER